MALRVYNTLTRAKEDFETVTPGKVGMYLCGPTVYKPSHIGHMVGPVIFDTIKRYLEYSGFETTFVINITDVDDKLIAGAQKNNTTVDALADAMTEDYHECLALMGVDSVDRFPKATEHIDEMLSMIGTLVENGNAYPLDGDVYFATDTDEDYGKLSRRSTEEMMSGTRAETRTGKRNPADFALWKSSKADEPAWESPWGPGRPGWHIECSAMSRKYLGDSFDIHGGGLDLLFPHHENELAQSETCTGHPFARYWLHNGLMQAADAAKLGGDHDRHGDTGEEDQVANKLAGSQGAESVKTAVFAHHPPEIVRFFLLNTHYRSPIPFSLENISAAADSAQSFYRMFETFERITATSFYSLEVPRRRDESPAVETGDDAFSEDLNHHKVRFLDAMDDDFNTGGAIGVLFDLRKRINGYIAENKLEAAATDAQKADLTAAIRMFKELSNLLGVFRAAPEKAGAADDGFSEDLMQLFISLRAGARKDKNFALSDAIRDGLKAIGVTLEDRPDGTLWHRD